MKKLIILIYILLIISCKGTTEKNTENINHKIKSITISTYGGQMGYFQSLKITKDSLFFNFNLAVDESKKRTQNKLNINYKLGEIISKTELISFPKIINGESMQPVDGTDTKIMIETKENNYSVINAKNNKIWRNTKEKMNQILDKEFK